MSAADELPVCIRCRERHVAQHDHLVCAVCIAREQYGTTHRTTEQGTR